MISWRGRYQFDKIADCITNHHSEKLEEFAVAEMALQLFISLRQDFLHSSVLYCAHSTKKNGKSYELPMELRICCRKVWNCKKIYPFKFYPSRQ